jgi:hypothetical protein
MGYCFIFFFVQLICLFGVLNEKLHGMTVVTIGVLHLITAFFWQDVAYVEGLYVTASIWLLYGIKTFPKQVKLNGAK